MTAPELPDTAADLLRRLQARGAVRDFRPDPVPEAWLDALLAAGQRAPTSSNLQACSVIVVRDAQLREQLATLASNQRHVVDCPVFLVFCADLSRVALACEAQGAAMDDTLELGLVASIDAALVAMTLAAAAETMGLASVFIGALRNHPGDVARLLGLPQRAFAAFGLCLGWPRTPPVPKPRLPRAAFVHEDRYDSSASEAALADYDRQLALHYRARGKETTDDSWSRTTGRKFSVGRRRALRAELAALGLKME
ncbi:MAG: NADPH-dependent oxidoreductase [Burkholderiales bacterium]|nr:NADPH-dependent oxidoreductase [Burkholderiales bacterium]